MVHWNATIVVGVKLGEIYSEKTVTKQVPRFDIYTGEPYSVEIQVIERTFLNNRLADLEIDEDKNVFVKHERNFDFVQFKDLKLKLFCRYSSVVFSDVRLYDQPLADNTIVGKQVGETADFTGNHEDDIPVREFDEKEIKKALTHVSYQFSLANFHANVRPFIILYSS